MSAIRVVVVDDHSLFRRGLIEVLQEGDDLEVVGQAQDGKEAIEQVAKLSPDVVFMDLNLPGQRGIDTTAYITQRWPEIKVLILTASEEPTDLMQALGVGAQGYILKTVRPQEIIDALRQVHQGFVVISPSMAPRFISELSQPGATRRAPELGGGAPDTQLTAREVEILQLVARGLSNSDIAEQFTLTVNTVKTHMKNILGKLHLKNRHQAAAHAAKVGLRQQGASGVGS